KPFVIGHRNWIMRSPTDPDDSFPSAPVVIAGKYVIIASQKGLLWNVAGDTGDKVWAYRKVNGEVSADLTTDQVRVYVPCLNGYLYAFEAMTGAPSWNQRLEGKLDQAALVVGKSILVPSTGKGLYALSSTDGQIKWLSPGVTQVVGAAGNKIFATNAAKNLLIINAENGSVERTLAVPNVKHYLPSTSKTVIILTTDGRLTSIEPDAS
ncbi:MAG: PQQ-binding-like beta-propeller repeat protein, partial [Phycisphaerae bacterium]